MISGNRAGVAVKSPVSRYGLSYFQLGLFRVCVDFVRHRDRGDGLDDDCVGVGSVTVRCWDDLILCVDMFFRGSLRLCASIRSEIDNSVVEMFYSLLPSLMP